MHIAAKGNFLDFKGFFDAQYLLVELGTMVSVGTTDVSMASRVSGVYSSTSEQLPLRDEQKH